MENRLIYVELPKTKVHLSPKRQYEDWVARFCFAAAKLPDETVEHILSLMETCGENPEVRKSSGGTA